MADLDQHLAALLPASGKMDPAPARLAEALVPDYSSLYARSIADPVAYWDEVARREQDWFSPWHTAFAPEGDRVRWFVGATCNITHNCLDRHVASQRRNKAALIWLGEDGQERIFTFATLQRAVAQMASGLKAHGIGKGDRVVIYMPLTPEGIMAMLACARIGAVHSVVYAGLGAGSLRERILDAQAKAVICADVGYRRGKVVPLKPIVDEALQDGMDQHPLMADLKVIVHRRQGGELRPGEVDLLHMQAAGSAHCPPEVMDSEDWLFILYTSGSTGKPKGTAYVHGGYAVGCTHQWRLAHDIHEDDLYWCMSDIGWIVGHSIMVYGPLANGTTILVREGAPDYPHPGATWEIVERYGVTKLQTAPTSLRMFMRMGAEHPAQYDLSSLKFMVCAGEPLNPEAQLWAYKYILRERGPVLDNWWQTETAAPTIGTLPAEPVKPGRAGKPFPGIVAEVLDRSGRPVPPGQGGLLALRGYWPHMFRTVWGAPERYRQYFSTIPGVYTAGDVANVDAEGYIMVLGRADDVLNVAGHRIGTADVESALVSHPAVGEAAVIGKPDPLKGEAIKAFILLRAGHAPSEALAAALTEHVRKVIGPIATPSEIEFAAKLPKTRSGKIMRRVLKAKELGIDPGDLTTIEE